MRFSDSTTKLFNKIRGMFDSSSQPPYYTPAQWYGTGVSFPYRFFTSSNVAETPWINSAFFAAVQWMANTFPEAPMYLEHLVDGEWIDVHTHPVLDILSMPNPYYSGSTLWGSTLLSRCANGNGYWVKTRDSFGVPDTMWYYPHHMIWPRWTMDPGAPYIGYYASNYNGVQQAFSPDDVVHLRSNMLDPANPRMGISPLVGMGLELSSDQEGAKTTDYMLKQMGIQVPLVNPLQGYQFDEASGPDFVNSFMEKTTGANRGKPVVSSIPIDLKMVGATPKDLDMSNLRRAAATRVCAALNIDPMVIGIQGEAQTFNNKTEAREAAYESCIIPLQRSVCEELKVQLLPDFVSNPKEWRLNFDLRKVRALQSDMDKLAVRVSALYEKRVITRADAKRMLGLPYDEEDKNTYYEYVQKARMPATSEAAVKFNQSLANIEDTKKNAKSDTVD